MIEKRPTEAQWQGRTFAKLNTCSVLGKPGSAEANALLGPTCPFNKKIKQNKVRDYMNGFIRLTSKEM